tara:strand:- start:225 stop:1103 length:879 start_codon:yes stop_codon:yes gene_type:complete
MINSEDLKNRITLYYDLLLHYIINRFTIVQLNVINFIIYWYNIIRNDIYETDNFKNRVINYYNIFKIEYLGNSPIVTNVETKVIRYYNAMSCNYNGNENYNRDLKKYREEFAIPISFLMMALIIHHSTFLTNLLLYFYKYIIGYIIICMLIYLPMLVYKISTNWKRIGQMLKMAKVINKKTEMTMSVGNRISFLFVGDLNVLWDYSFDYKEIERRYNEVKNGKLVDTQRMGFVGYAIIGHTLDLYGNINNFKNDLLENVSSAFNPSRWYQNLLTHPINLLNNAIRNNQRRIQ